MTTIAIQEQVSTIKKATTKASRSQKAAREFLLAAGIITASSISKTTKKKK